MTEKFHCLKFKNLSKNWEYMFPLGKMEFRTHLEFCGDQRIFGLRRGLEYLYQLSDVLPKQIKCELKSPQVRVYTQQ